LKKQTTETILIKSIKEVIKNVMIKIHEVVNKSIHSIKIQVRDEEIRIKIGRQIGEHFADAKTGGIKKPFAAG